MPMQALQSSQPRPSARGRVVALHRDFPLPRTQDDVSRATNEQLLAWRDHPALMCTELEAILALNWELHARGLE